MIYSQVFVPYLILRLAADHKTQAVSASPQIRKKHEDLRLLELKDLETEAASLVQKASVTPPLPR